MGDNTSEAYSGPRLSDLPLRALVVDDHEFVRMAIKDVLLQLGVSHVDEAGDGAEAISSIAHSATPHILIFCDLQMPNCDGIETLRAFAHAGTTAGIVLMSSEDEGVLAASANVAESQGLRILGYAPKPVSAHRIGEFLAQASIPFAPKSVARAIAAIDDLDIRRGLSKEEFFLVFQPKINVQTKELHGVEALIRWRHPDHGMVSPLAFVSVAEESETIDLLTDVVFAKAIEAQKQWGERGQKIHVAVNISTRSMVRLDMPDRMADSVAMAGGDPATIILEVTESRLVEDLSAFLDIATRLRLKGFRLAIDDFGTGFSTLEQLSRLPVSELKIDRAFVAGAPDNPRTRAILEASLQMAKSLKLTTICEGAETEAEWDLAAALGADCVQGYYVCRPMKSEELLGWYETWRSRT